MLVKENYKIDEDVLEEMIDTSEYWEKCHKFYHEVKEKEFSQLTPKQAEWLSKIEESLEGR